MKYLNCDALYLGEYPALQERKGEINQLIFLAHHLHHDPCLLKNHSVGEMYKMCLLIINDILGLRIDNLYFYVGIAKSYTARTVHEEYTNNICHQKTMNERCKTLNTAENYLRARGLPYKPNWIVLAHGSGASISYIENELISLFLKSTSCDRYRNCLNCSDAKSSNLHDSVLYLKLYYIENQEDALVCKKGGNANYCQSGGSNQDSETVYNGCYFYPVISRIEID